MLNVYIGFLYSLTPLTFYHGYPSSLFFYDVSSINAWIYSFSLIKPFSIQVWGSIYSPIWEPWSQMSLYFKDDLILMQAQLYHLPSPIHFNILIHFFTSLKKILTFIHNKETRLHYANATKHFIRFGKMILPTTNKITKEYACKH